VEAIERLTLAQISLLPHLEANAQKPPTPAEAVAEFDAWLAYEPEIKVRTMDSDLRELIGVS
jgi:hypothetical protein